MCATHAARDRDRARRRYREAMALHARADTAAKDAVAEYERIRASAQEAGVSVEAPPDATEGDWTTVADERTLANIVLSGAEDDMHAAHARLADTREALTQARRSLAAAQRDYDVTPAGIAALQAAADAATSRADRVRTLAQLTWAREQADAIQQAWKRSSVYTEQRIARTRTPKTLSGLRRDLMERRCTEHGVISPPSDPKARASWDDSPDGVLWARVNAIVGETADLTFMLPQMLHAHDRTDVEAAHWPQVPARFVPTTTTAWLARARATDRPWTPSTEVLTEAIAAAGEVRTARKGAFVDARRADTWHIAPVTGPLRLPGSDLTVRDGWVAARDRDAEVRALSTLDRFHAPA